jgi:hypothetical protein
MNSEKYARRERLRTVTPSFHLLNSKRRSIHQCLGEAPPWDDVMSLC